jgi:predicted Zn-dependent peptidase
LLHETIIEAERYVDTEELNSYYQRAGGTRLTAQTEQEYMKFDINLPTEQLELFFRIEADRMVNSQWRRFDSEVDILWEQRLGDVNRPDTLFKEALASASGVVSPIYWNEGYDTDFPILERNYTRRLFETWFVPNNTIIVLVGDTTLEQAKALTHKYFDRIPRGEETHDTLAIEPVPAHHVRVEMQTPNFGPAIDVRHRIPGVGHPDRPAVELLVEVLGDARGPIGAATIGKGLASRLTSNTVVTHTNRFSFPATMNLVVHGDDLGALEPVLVDALEALRDEPIEDSVIAAAKKRRRAYWERRRLNWDDIAFDIGHYAIMDSWQTFFREMDAVQEVTASKLQAAARKYLVKTNRIVGIATREPVQ